MDQPHRLPLRVVGADAAVHARHGVRGLRARRGCVGCNADDVEAHVVVVATTFTLADEEEHCGNNEGHKQRAAPRWRPL